MKSLVWFKSDLRIEDNPALRAACSSYEEVQAVYIFSKNQLASHNEANVKIDFIVKNLFFLEKSLSELNIPLTIRQSYGFEEDPKLIQDISLKRNIDKVYWNKQFGEDESNRDSITLDLLEKSNIKVESFYESVVYKPGSLKTGQGTPYSVFTPFKRKWIENFEMDFLDIDFKYQRKTSSEITSNIKDFNFNLEQAHAVDMNLWPAGEQEANERLINFLNEKANDYSKNIQWRYDEDEFNAWKEGRTGFPIVDAAMRQLLHEGWMHNRLRMVVAMFFTKNMLHDWRLGEAYFMQNLIDGDFASNNGGWQWSSSTGTDAAPYFRIFNPITQSTNFDKEGKFIKKYIPEFKDLDKSVIHNPSKEHRKYCKYPEPILDLKESRLRAIEAFKIAKS